MGTATGWNHPAQISWSLVTHWPTLLRGKCCHLMTSSWYCMVRGFVAIRGLLIFQQESPIYYNHVKYIYWFAIFSWVYIHSPQPNEWFKCRIDIISIHYLTPSFTHWGRVMHLRVRELGRHCFRLWIFVRRAGLMRSQQDFEWWWSVPLSSASLY